MLEDENDDCTMSFLFVCRCFGRRVEGRLCLVVSERQKNEDEEDTIMLILNSLPVNCWYGACRLRAQILLDLNSRIIREGDGSMIIVIGRMKM